MLQPKRRRASWHAVTYSGVVRTHQSLPNRTVEMTDAGVEWEEARKNRPWSDADVTRLISTLRDLVRTHQPLDLPDGTTRATFDGPAYWRLLAALDREAEYRRNAA